MRHRPVDLTVEVAPSVLHDCAQQCADFITQHGRVEPGGVSLGTFDGQTISIRSLLLDEDAESTPVSIQFGPRIFSQAEQLTARHNESASFPWFIVGTWHGHPPGHSTYSNVDARTLFQDQMRIHTDDPSMAVSPWVHLIFPNYGLEPEQVSAYTLHVTPSFTLDPAENPLGGAREDGNLEVLLQQGLSLGLIVSSTENQELQERRLERYHPEVFRRHRSHEISIMGMWRHYPFPTVTHAFERVFLENFFQKSGIPHFYYARSLRSSGGISTEWFMCHRAAGNSDPPGVVTFVSVGITPVSEHKD